MKMLSSPIKQIVQDKAHSQNAIISSYLSFWAKMPFKKLSLVLLMAMAFTLLSATNTLACGDEPIHEVVPEKHRDKRDGNLNGPTRTFKKITRSFAFDARDNDPPSPPPVSDRPNFPHPN